MIVYFDIVCVWVLNIKDQYDKILEMEDAGGGGGGMCTI